MIAAGKKEVTHGLERHLARGLRQQACHCRLAIDRPASVLPGTAIAQMGAQGLQPLGIGQVALVYGQ